MTTDIPIKYINATSNTDFEVVVFTKNFSVNTPKTYYAAWQILRGQTSVQFVYPVSMSVGATYKSGGQLITAGPFPAKLGSTWEITQESAADTAVLKQSKTKNLTLSFNIIYFSLETGVPANPNNTIVIKNIPPASWSGRMFDVGIYKEGRLLVTQPDVHIGNQIDFMLQPKLYFGVVRNMHVGDTFTSLEITSALTEFDLSNFPNGLEVTLNEAPGGGRYSFSGQAMI